MRQDLKKLSRFLEKGGFESEHKDLLRVIRASWYDSLVDYMDEAYGEASNLAEQYFKEYLPYTPFGAAITTLVGLMPKGHSSSSASGLDMANFKIFESEESFFNASKSIVPSVSRTVYEVLPLTGDAIDISKLIENLVRSTNCFIMGDSEKGELYATEAAVMTAFVLTPNIIEHLMRAMKSAYRALFKSKFPEIPNADDVYSSEVEDAVGKYKEVYFNNKHYDVSELDEPNMFDYTVRHSINFNVPRQSVINRIGDEAYNSYIRNIESKVVDRFTLIDEDASREFFVIKDPIPENPNQIWYKSSGTGDRTSSGEFSRIEGIAEFDDQDWFAKTYRAKVPAPETIDYDIKNAFESKNISPGNVFISYGDYGDISGKVPEGARQVYYDSAIDLNNRVNSAGGQAFHPSSKAVNISEDIMYTPSFTSFSQTASAMRRDNFIIRNFSGEDGHFSFGEAAADYVSKISARSTENPVAKSVLDIYIKGRKGNAREFSVEFSKSEIADAFNYFYSRSDNTEVALDLLNHTAFADGYVNATSKAQQEAFERYGMEIANSVGFVIESCISDAKAFKEMAVSENRYEEYYEIFGEFVEGLPQDMKDMINGVSPFDGVFK